MNPRQTSTAISTKLHKKAIKDTHDAHVILG